MQELRLGGVHDDGEHLVLLDEAGGEHRLRIDDALKAAVRRDRPRLGQLQIEIDGDVRPRDVQAMIRAGASAEEVAARTGWSPERVARFEGPVIAEREHVATRAQGVRLRGTNAAGATETLAQRAATRLGGRGVDAATVRWDAARDADGQWSVSAGFPAGGRDRLATWWFDVAGLSVVAKNDEARWLSEADAPAGAVPAQVHRPTSVFDVEAQERATGAGRPATDDLIASMRETSGARARRRGRRRPTAGDEGEARMVGEEVLPLDTTDERPAETAETAVASGSAEPDLPPAAHGPHPLDEARHESPSDESPSEKDEDEPDDDGGVVTGAADTSTDHSAAPSTGEVARSGATSTTGRAGRRGGGRRATRRKGPPQVRAAGDGDEPDDQADDGPPVEPAVVASQEPAEERHVGGEGDEGGGSGTAAAPDATPRKKGRARVPSWDDVMFGARRD